MTYLEALALDDCDLVQDAFGKTYAFLELTKSGMKVCDEHEKEYFFSFGELTRLS